MIKFIVYFICDCLTHSFVCFFVVTRIKIIWHISFDFVGIQITLDVGFVFTHATFIWFCLWVLVSFSVSTVFYMPAWESSFLLVVLSPVVSHISLIMKSTSMSGILSNAVPLPGTTKNLHLTHLTLCLIFIVHLLSCSV